MSTKAGRPTFKPTEAQRILVAELAGTGFPQSTIAKLIAHEAGLAIAPKTLRKYFRNEIDEGSTIANCRVAQNLFQIATSKSAGAVTAAIFWLKCRAGWKEPAYNNLIEEEPIDVDKIRKEIMRGIIPRTPEDSVKETNGSGDGVPKPI